MKPEFGKIILSAVLLLTILLSVCSCSAVSAEKTSAVYADGQAAFPDRDEIGRLFALLDGAEEAAPSERTESDFDMMLIMENGTELLLEGGGGTVTVRVFSINQTLKSERTVRSEALNDFCAEFLEYTLRPVLDRSLIRRITVSASGKDTKTYEEPFPDWLDDFLSAYQETRSGKLKQRASQPDVEWTLELTDGTRLRFADGLWNTILYTYGTDGKRIATQLLYSDALFDLLYSVAGMVHLPKPDGYPY